MRHENDMLLLLGIFCIGSSVDSSAPEGEFFSLSNPRGIGN